MHYSITCTRRFIWSTYARNGVGICSLCICLSLSLSLSLCICLSLSVCLCLSGPLSPCLCLSVCLSLPCFFAKHIYMGHLLRNLHPPITIYLSLSIKSVFSQLLKQCDLPPPDTVPPPPPPHTPLTDLSLSLSLPPSLLSFCLSLPPPSSLSLLLEERWGMAGGWGWGVVSKIWTPPFHLSSSSLSLYFKYSLIRIKRPL